MQRLLSGFLFSSAQERDRFAVLLRASILVSRKIIQQCDAEGYLFPSQLTPMLAQLFQDGSTGQEPRQHTLQMTGVDEGGSDADADGGRDEGRVQVFTALIPIWRSLSVLPLPPPRALSEELGWPLVGLLPGERVNGSQLLASRTHPKTTALSRGLFLITNHRIIYRTYKVC